MEIKSYTVTSKLPNPFLFKNGQTVKTVEDWEKRAEEIYPDAVTWQYGDFPDEPEFLDVHPIHAPWDTKYESYRITTGKKGKEIIFTMYIYRPCNYVHGKKYPVAINGDMCFGYFAPPENVKLLTDNGIAYVIFNRCELADDNRFRAPRDAGFTGTMYDIGYIEKNVGVISAWAWGYSRCLDALEKIGIADMSCVAFTGCSRGAKTALLAGIMDKRATVINPVDSCQGGLSSYRVHMEAYQDDGEVHRDETLWDINRSYPWWFGEHYGDYVGKEDTLPFDSHYVAALLAPRRLIIGTAANYIWGNPLGAYQTYLGAREVYKLFGKENNIKFYCREGNHGQQKTDYELLVNQMLADIKGEKDDERFENLIFDAPDPAFDWKYICK